MEFKFTKHAEEEMKRRKIPREFIESVLDSPQQIVEEYGGKKAYQSKINFGSGKIYLLRVIVDDSREPPTVITVYRTSKISKYWR